MTLRSFWQIIILSFYSSDLYLSVANRWKHWGLKFLLRFSLLVAAIVSITLFIMVSAFDFEERRSLFDEFPPLKIENNQASIVDTQVSSPFVLKYPNSTIDFIVIDLNAMDAKKYAGKNVILFAKDKIIFSEVDDFALPYRNLLINTDITILNGDNIINLLKLGQNKLINIILFLGIPVGSLFCFLTTLLKSFLYAAIAKLLSRICNYNLSFKQLTRLAIIANVPAFFLQVLLWLMSFGIGSIAQVIAENVYLLYFTYAFIICGRSAAIK